VTADLYLMRVDVLAAANQIFNISITNQAFTYAKLRFFFDIRQAWMYNQPPEVDRCVSVLVLLANRVSMDIWKKTIEHKLNIISTQHIRLIYNGRFD